MGSEQKMWQYILTMNDIIKEVNVMVMHTFEDFSKVTDENFHKMDRRCHELERQINEQGNIIKFLNDRITKLEQGEK